jgi:hypothetical protein
MNQSDALRVMEAYREFEAGECIKAVKGLREFADRIDDPWTKAELLYHQIVFLAQMDDAVHARSCFNELKQQSASSCVIWFSTPLMTRRLPTWL